MARRGGVAHRTGANLVRATRRVLVRTALPREGGVWVQVRLASRLDDVAQPRLPFSRPAPPALLEVLEILHSAADDPRVSGVLLRMTGPLQGWSRVMSLRRAVERVRESGKPVVAYADVLGGESLVVASAASKLWLPVSGSVFLVGLRLEGFYLRRLLEELEIRPEVVRVGSHKTAGELFTRESMSPESREQLEALADDLFGALVDSIAAGRGLDAEAVRGLVDRGPWSAPAAVEAGLIDGCLYPDEVEDELRTLAPRTATDREGRPRIVPGELYHALCAADPGWRPLLRDLPRFAYVVARGMIHRGGGPRGIASDTVRDLLEAIRRDDGVRGVVLRIESGGGDGIASDLLWRSVARMRDEKPVVVSMGDVVASGGYYMAAAADALFAEAGTVTGSIGVVGGKVDLEGFYRRFGIDRDAVERGARAGLLSEARGFTADERVAVRETLSSLYGTFVDRVASGRGLSTESVQEVAQGRLWSGARARTLGLVDAIGGPLEALLEARRRAGLHDDDRYVLELHPRFPVLPSLRALLRFVPGRMDVW